MTANPVVVHGGEPLDRLAGTMQGLRIHHVPVVDDADHLIGIVSDRDVRSAIGRGDQNREPGLVAEDVMSHDVVCVEPAADLTEAVELMREHRFGALPVVDHQSVVGIITKHDLIGQLKETLTQAATHYQPW
jgi:CBS domain-containing protein